MSERPDDEYRPLENRQSPGEEAAGLQASADPEQLPFEVLIEQLIASSDNSLKRIAGILQQDTALRGQVIREANAFIYSFGRPIANLPQAIACLGYNRCRAIIRTMLVTPNGAQTFRLSAGRSGADQPGQPQPGKRGALLRGHRSYRKERLSSLYPPKNRRRGPHFLSSLFEQT